MDKGFELGGSSEWLERLRFREGGEKVGDEVGYGGGFGFYFKMESFRKVLNKGVMGLDILEGVFWLWGVDWREVRVEGGRLVVR